MRIRSLSALLATVSLLLSPMGAVEAEGYSGGSAVPYMQSHGIMTGYGNGDFGAYSFINRAEFLTTVMRGTGRATGGGRCFTDVHTEWFAPYVCAARSQGLVTGYGDGRFRPAQTINVAEASAILVRAYKGALAGGHVWFAPYLQTMAEWDALPASIRNIYDPLTRLQMAEMVYAIEHDGAMDEEEQDEDLTVTITDANDPVAPGERVTYRIRIENDGDEDVEIDVKAMLDTDMDFVSANDDGDEDDGDVEWEDVEIDEDDDVELTLTVEIDDDADDGDVVELKVQARNATELEKTHILDEDDDRDLSLSIDDSRDPAEEDELVTYTITIENDGDDDEELFVRAELDADMRFVSADHGGVHDSEEDTVEWDSVAVDEDDETKVKLTVRIDDDAKNGDEVLLRVFAGGEEAEERTEIEDDDDDDNDNDSDVRLTLTDSSDPVEAGEVVTYRIRLENRDDDDTYVDMRAILDPSMDFIAAGDGGYLFDDDEVRWEDVEIDEDEQRTVLLTVRINDKADDGDTVRLRVRSGDAQATETTRVEDDNDDDDDDAVSVTITDSPDPARVGDIVTYRIRLENDALSRSYARVIAYLDDGMSFSSASDDGRFSGGDEVEWESVSIDRTDSLTLLLRVRITAEADDGDTLRLRVEAGDDVDTETTRVED